MAWGSGTRGFARWAAVVSVVVLILAPVAARRAASGIGEPPQPMGSVTFTLYGTNQGWGFTAATVASPGPTLPVNESDAVTMNLYSANGVRHNFYVDYNGNAVPNPPAEPVSADFSSPTTPLVYPFTAGAPGTYTYYCDYHNGKMLGAFVIQAAPPPNTAPSATLSAPTGTQDWTGGSPHRIWWNMSDAQDGNPALAVYLNYSSSAGSGAIAGPLAGTANPNSYVWTVPAIDTADLAVNLTAVDTGGLRGWSTALVPVVDSTPPSVASTVPGNGATGVLTSTNVQVTWTEAMNPIATGSPGTFGLQEVGTGAWVAGAFSWNGPQNTVLTFNPSANLAPATQYRSVVNASARDASEPGNLLASPYTATFTTGAGADTQPPQISGVAATPPLQDVGGRVNVTATVIDNVAVGGVWLEVRSPSAALSNASMVAGPGNEYSLERTYGEVGAYTCTVWAADTSGLWNSTSCGFTMRDTLPPQISAVAANPATQQVGSAVNVSATVMDNVGVAGVWLEVRGPAGPTNASMASGPGGAYSLNQTYANAGAHPFTVWAVDTSGLWASASGQFDIVAATPPTIQHTPLAAIVLGDPTNVTANVTDAVGVAEVRVNWTDPVGMMMNMTMPFAGGSHGFELPAQMRAGTLTYFVWARNVNGLTARTPAATVPVQPPPGYLVLYGDATLGWGFGPDNLTSPGPTIRVPTGATVNLLLLGLDGAPHNFFVDYTGDRVPGAGEPLSANFRDRGVRLTFVADREGTFTYYCEYHTAMMRGSFVVGDPAGGTPEPGSPFAWIAGVALLLVAVAVVAIVARRRRSAGPPPERS